MTRLQALTLCRDAVAATKGVYANLWYDGPNKHCTIGAITQVAVNAGFDEQLAKQMMQRARVEMGHEIEQRIVAITDDPSRADLSPLQRREHILAVLDNAIALENEKATTVVPSDTKGLNDAENPASVVHDKTEKARA